MSVSFGFIVSLSVLSVCCGWTTNKKHLASGQLGRRAAAALSHAARTHDARHGFTVSGSGHPADASGISRPAVEKEGTWKKTGVSLT